jgi:hypothetical protein
MARARAARNGGSRTAGEGGWVKGAEKGGWDGCGTERVFTIETLLTARLRSLRIRVRCCALRWAGRNRRGSLRGSVSGAARPDAKTRASALLKREPRFSPRPPRQRSGLARGRLARLDIGRVRRGNKRVVRNRSSRTRDFAAPRTPRWQASVVLRRCGSKGRVCPVRNGGGTRWNGVRCAPKRWHVMTPGRATVRRHVVGKHPLSGTCPCAMPAERINCSAAVRRRTARRGAADREVGASPVSSSGATDGR